MLLLYRRVGLELAIAFSRPAAGNRTSGLATQERPGDQMHLGGGV